jgi:hypothetical protein
LERDNKKLKEEKQSALIAAQASAISASAAIAAVNTLSSDSDADSGTESGSNDITCAICLTNKANVVMINCGHARLCDECCNQLKNKSGGSNSLTKKQSIDLKECPICRQWSTYRRIYL